MKKTLLTLLLPLLLLGGLRAQLTEAHRTVSFRFVPGSDTLYIPFAGNENQMAALNDLIDRYRPQIADGRLPIYVDGYCTSGTDPRTSFAIAVVRSNRVKSELITHKRLVEANFITKNRATAYTAPDGKSYRDIVVVTLQIPAAEAGEAPEPKPKETVAITGPEPQPIIQEEPEPQPKQQELAPAPRPRRHRIALRTNALYDALLLPTLGIEWRAGERFGLKLDGSYSFWGSETGRVQKIWLVSPEVRWYLGGARRWYVGAAGNFGEFNVYKGMIGNMVSGDTGYQGQIYGAGLTVGYQLPLGRCFAIDFNLGLGYTRFEYDSFTMVDRTRVYKEKDRVKNIWGPMQAGITFVWFPL